MLSPRHDLAQLQSWMQSVIMHPTGVLDGVASEAAQAQIAVAAAEVETVIERSARQTSVERLQIYAGAYYARLLECMRAEYPVMTQAMGPELFDEFAVEYLQRYPSQSYTLNLLGADFAAFLEETRPQSTTEDHSWLDFLVDLARLEWCFSEVFDGPGAEGLGVLTADQVQAISPDSWPDARLTPTPSLRILTLDFPVQDYYRAIRSGDEPAPPSREPTWLAISRRNYVVRHYALTALEAEILAAILAGDTVGDAIGRYAITADLDTLAVDLQRWFREWTAEGFFLGIALGDTAGDA